VDGVDPITDAPLIETKEVLGGVHLLEAHGLDQALTCAKLAPIGDGGVEVARWSTCTSFERGPGETAGLLALLLVHEARRATRADDNRRLSSPRPTC
jgi:hypothetical protein